MHICRCGRLLDSLGHHRAACGRVGVLGRPGICNRECCHSIVPRRRRRVATEHYASTWTFQCVARCLPLFGDAQVTVDATLVSPLHGSARRTPNVHISGTCASKHHQNSTRRHPKTQKRNGGGKGKDIPFWVEPRRVEPQWVRH